MTLIRNSVGLSMNPMRISCATAGAYGVARSLWVDTGSMRGFDAGEATVVGGASLSETAGRPNGYGFEGDSWLLARRAGGLAAYVTISHDHVMSANAAQGVNLGATLVSAQDLTASLGLVVALLSTMTASTAVTPSMLAAANMASTMASSGDIAGAMSALANMVMTLTASGDISGNLRGTADMAADMSTEGVLVTGNPGALADAVWQYLLGSITTGQLLQNTASKTSASVVADAGNTAITFKTDLPQTTNDHWKDCLIVFTSGVLDEQIKKISGYNGTTKFVTVTPSPGFTSAPSAADTFLILNR